MPSLLEAVTSVLGADDVYDKLADVIGADTDHATAATDLAVPAILGGLASRAAEDDGSEAVVAVVDRADVSVLDDLDRFLDGGDGAGGEELLDDLFGTDRHDLVGHLASKAEMGGSMVARLLTMVTPIVIGTVGRRRLESGLDGDGLTTLLAAERNDLEREGLLVPAGYGESDGIAVADLPGPVTLDQDSTDIDAVTGPVGPSSTVGAGSLDDGDGHRSAFGWLWWALGAVVLVLLLAWLLSTCDDETGASEPENTVVQIDEQVEEDGGGDSPLVAAPETEPDVGPAIDLEDRVATVLVGSGVSASVTDGAVTLTGSVETDSESAQIERAVERLPDVVSVDNQVLVERDEPTEEPGDIVPSDDDGDGGSGGESDGDGDGDGGSDGDGDVAAGATINELLDLDPVTFDVRSARITADGRSVLDRAVEFLESNPDVRIEIGGHTDNDGAEDANQELSRRRSEAVKAYLEGEGIGGARMETRGYGETEPVVPNDSLAAKAENRRIEFTIL